ncbi:unnamed protein product, partial [Strongylus vulgaris]
MVIEPDGNAHGVFVLNTNAQEVTTAPGPTLIYRTIGGNLDLYFFPGPTPEEVTQQYLELIGKPFLPAYWALGFQISRYGYKHFGELNATIERNIAAGIPFDTVVCDIDYMDSWRDFTIGDVKICLNFIFNFKNLPAYIRTLRSRGMRSVFIFDHAIAVNYTPFERAMKAGARFVEWERKDQVMRSAQERYALVNDTKIMLGVLFPSDYTAFPDFLDDNTANWWIDEFAKFHEE